MAYSVNGKIYTDHPLMDEIVHCCKTIFNGIVVKNDALAISYETENSITKSTEFINIVENRIKFNTFPFTEDMLKAYTKNGERVFTDEEVASILEDRYVIPAALRSDTFDFCKKYYISNYKYDEENNYYRSLAGLPPYPGTVYNINRDRSDQFYNIYVYPSDFPSDYNTDHIPFHAPKDDPLSEIKEIEIYLLSNDDISVLEQSGFIDTLISEYKGFNYSYLKYLGYKSIDIYKSRKAVKWEILYIPRVEEMVQERFIELYNINRAMYLKRTYQDAMSLGSNHYDESLILLLLSQTFSDMIVDVPEWYIRRDIFDIRSVQYFLESFGVEFFDVIPLKYQIAIVKNLNKLIKYKSSTRNINDIIDLFNLEGTYAYKYFLYKKKINESNDTNPENYDLEFIKVKQGDAFDKYIDDNIYRYDYDELTLSDKFWDGVYREWTRQDKPFKEKLHEEVKDNHIEDADFTVEGTKYMSIDYEVDMSKYQYQVEYFFSLLLDSEINSDDLKIVVPSISTSREINVSDLFVMLYLLSFAYDGVSDAVSEIVDEDGKVKIKGKRPENNPNHQEKSISKPLVEYYEQLYTDDGDFDDYIKWNEVFGTYHPPKFFDTEQFDFGGIEVEDGDESSLGAIIYNFHQTPPEEIPDPDIDEGWDFMDPINIDYEEYFKQFFKPKHWEVKSYIENLDPVATSQGYNSFPVWLDNRDWIYRFSPEALETSYDRINGFNFELTTDDLDDLLEFIERKDKVHYFEHGYMGYSYEPVFDIDDNLLYYQINYEYSEDYYNFDQYIQYIVPTLLDPKKSEEYNQWLYTEEAYNVWVENQKELFMTLNPRGPLGIGGFRVVKKLDRIQDIMDDFDVNTLCYNDLMNRILNSQNRDENIILRYVFNKLFTRKFDYKFYQVNGEDVDYMNSILKDRNYLLYNYYNSIINESNITARQNNIRSLMNDIINTLEYYLRGDNLEFIYSSFSIASFSSLLYYIYLMINFFKSWKVYFLDPAVTMNANNKLENSNNYGTGCDNLAEIKINYWKEDKDFKRDNISLNTSLEYKDEGSTAQDRYKEVLDVYGRYDPDPTSDNDYDGFSPENDKDESRHNIIREKDVNGGVVNGVLNIPYNMINGGKAYGKLIDIWDLDGSTPEEHVIVADANGGGPYHQEDYYYNRDFDNLYVINAGNPGTNKFWTKSIHTKVTDRQIEQEVLVSDKEANIIVSDENGIYIQQAWASWDQFNYYRDISENAYEYINYVMDVLYDDLIVITDEEAMQAEINSIIDEDLSNMRKVVDYGKNIDQKRADYKAYIDNSINDLEIEFSDFSPYDWENFTD